MTVVLFNWMLLCGLLAIAMAILNLVFTRQGRNSKPFMIASLVLTALTAFFAIAYYICLDIIGLDRDLRPDGSICASLIAMSVILNGIAFLVKVK